MNKFTPAKLIQNFALHQPENLNKREKLRSVKSISSIIDNQNHILGQPEHEKRLTNNLQNKFQMQRLNSEFSLTYGKNNNF